MRLKWIIKFQTISKVNRRSNSTVLNRLCRKRKEMWIFRFSIDSCPSIRRKKFSINKPPGSYGSDCKSTVSLQVPRLLKPFRSSKCACKTVFFFKGFFIRGGPTENDSVLRSVQPCAANKFHLHKNFSVPFFRIAAISRRQVTRKIWFDPVPRE